MMFFSIEFLICICISLLFASAARIYSRKEKFLPLDIERKLNAHKTFRRYPDRLLNVFCTFNLHVSKR